MKLVEEYLHSIVSFNTASSKYCYSILFVFPSFQSGTRDVRASSSLRSSAASHPSSHTASGRYCCNPSTLFGYFESLFVSIPQAVGTVATLVTGGNFRCLFTVSIPQAVGTVVTRNENMCVIAVYNKFQYCKR